MRRARAATPAGSVDGDSIATSSERNAVMALWRSRHQERISFMRRGPPRLSARSGGTPDAAASFSTSARIARACSFAPLAARISPWSRPASSGHATRPFCRARSAPSWSAFAAPEASPCAPRRAAEARSTSRRTPSFWLFAASGRAFASAFSASARRPAATKPRRENGESRRLVVRHLLFLQILGRGPGERLNLPRSRPRRALRARDRRGSARRRPSRRSPRGSSGPRRRSASRRRCDPPPERRMPRPVRANAASCLSSTSRLI